MSVGRGELPPWQRAPTDRVELKTQKGEPRVDVFQQIWGPTTATRWRPALPCLYRRLPRTIGALAAASADVVVDAVAIHELAAVATVQPTEPATALVEGDFKA